MSVYENLRNLKVEIPKAPDPVGAYVAYKKTVNLLLVIQAQVLLKLHIMV